MADSHINNDGPIIAFINDSELSLKLYADILAKDGVNTFCTSSEDELIDFTLANQDRIAGISSDSSHPRSPALTRLIKDQTNIDEGLLQSDSFRIFCGVIDKFIPEASMIFAGAVYSTPHSYLLERWLEADPRAFASVPPISVKSFKSATNATLDRWHARNNSPITSSVELVNTIGEELAIACARLPDFMDSISPRKFEELVGAIFRNNGFAVELTSQTRDGGYDLVVAENTDVEGGIALVEVKKYRSDRTVGVDLVRQIYGVKTLQKADKCYLVTSSSVSPYAKREFSRVIPRELEFLEREDVIEWCRRYYASVIKED